VLLVFEDELERSQEALPLERIGDRKLMANVQVFHLSPPPDHCGGERRLELKSENNSASRASA